MQAGGYQDQGPDYRPNEAFQRVLEAKSMLDQRTWGNQGPGR